MDTSAAPYPTVPAHRPSRRRHYSSEPSTVPPQTPQNRDRDHRAHLQPASPEVISSLITSLSAISSQAQHHFESLTADEDSANYNGLNSVSTRSYHERITKEKSSTHQQGFGVDYGAYNQPQIDNTADSYFPDAAIPPVVRLAKPRAPEPIKDSGRKLSLRRSASSLRSSRSRESLRSTAEPPPAISPARGADSSGGIARRLLRRGSRDTLNSMESHDNKSHGLLGDDLVLAMSESNRRSLRSTPSSRSLVESRIDTAIAESETPGSKTHVSPVDTSAAGTPGSQSPSMGSPGGIGSGRPIPSRQSSLRHSFSGSPARQKRPARHSRHSLSGTKDIKVDKDLPEEDDGVVRRIRELQAAKQKRDQEFQAATSESTRRTRQRPEKPTPVPLNEVDSLQDPRRSAGHLSQIATNADIEEEDECAPSPAISTGKRRSQVVSEPLASATGNLQPKRSNSKTGSRSKSVTGKHGSRPTSPNRSSSVRDSKRNSGVVSPTRTSFGEGRPSTSDSIDDAVDAYLSAPRLTQKVRHPQSGRTIAFSEVGDPNGFAVICCVGMGLTRYLTAFYDELARTLRLRLITPDRPGVGESEPCVDGSGTPLAWPDDVAIICSHLKITKFSLLAHSAGAIYALATALRMPQQIRGRIHLLAPWIPPSQMSTIGSHREPLPSGVPYSQKILRALPTSFLKVANSSFMSATSASITSSLPNSPRNKSKRRSMTVSDSPNSTITPPTKTNNATSPSAPDNNNTTIRNLSTTADNIPPSADLTSPPPVLTPTNHAEILSNIHLARERDYDERLTHSIWHLATTNSNPALDLVTCLERRRPIGFRYVDITRAVVIHHGSRDNRVPVENVKWLGRIMRRCEVRILEGQGHGLMAVPGVMGELLGEIAKEWEDWAVITQRKGGRDTVGGDDGHRLGTSGTTGGNGKEGMSRRERAGSFMRGYSSHGRDHH